LFRPRYVNKHPFTVQYLFKIEFHGIDARVNFAFGKLKFLMAVKEVGAQPLRGKVFHRMAFENIKQLSKGVAVGAGGIRAVSLKQEVLLEAFVFRQIEE